MVPLWWLATRVVWQLSYGKNSPPQWLTFIAYVIDWLWPVRTQEMNISSFEMLKRNFFPSGLFSKIPRSDSRPTWNLQWNQRSSIRFQKRRKNQWLKLWRKHVVLDGWAFMQVFIHYLCISIKCDLPFWTKFRQTKFSTDKIFHLTKFSTPSQNFDTFVQCFTFVLKHWTQFSTDKIFRRTKFSTPSRNFDNFVRRIFVR